MQKNRIPAAQVATRGLVSMNDMIRESIPGSASSTIHVTMEMHNNRL
jgi:hypothetical protein